MAASAANGAGAAAWLLVLLCCMPIDLE
jgi:hypothetical protein